MFILSLMECEDRRNLLVAGLRLDGRYLYVDAGGAAYRFPLKDVIELSPVGDSIESASNSMTPPKPPQLVKGINMQTEDRRAIVSRAFRRAEKAGIPVERSSEF